MSERFFLATGFNTKKSVYGFTKSIKTLNEGTYKSGGGKKREKCSKSERERYKRDENTQKEKEEEIARSAAA